MLRALSATALALLLSAPAALAGEPRVPAPSEFELAAPERPAGIAANQGFVSSVVRAPQRFNLVGLEWRGGAEPEIALRAQKKGGGWTRWTPATGHHSRGTSEPIWTGPATQVQYRMSRSVRGLKLKFVDTTDTARALGRASASKRRRGGKARSSTRRPRIRPRSSWGSQYCPPRAIHYGSVRAAVVHHTVTANGYSKRQTRAALLAICRFHRNTNGWDDIGYNFLVDRFGRIWEGRAGGVDEAVMGAHAQGYNAQTTGISNLGTFTSVPQSDRAIAAMAKLIRWKLARHGVRRNGTVKLTSAGGASARYPAGTKIRFNRISGHRDTGLTSCPGEQLYRQLPELRERVGERLHPGLPVELDAELPELVTYSPGGVPLGGRLADTHAAPVAGAELELQELGQTGWETIASGLSGGDGTFSVLAPLTTNLVLRWRFAGDQAYQPFRGDGALVSVAPAISVAVSTDSVEPDERFRVTGTIDPPKTTRVKLIGERNENGVWRRAFHKKLKPAHGRIARNRRISEEGEYRLSVVFKGDELNGPAVSPYAYVTVEEPFLPF